MVVEHTRDDANRALRGLLSFALLLLAA